IQDFNPSEDTLDLTGITGLTRDKLAFNPTNQGVEVYSTDPNFNVRILLKGVAEGDLTAQNFLVACFVRGTAILTPTGEVPVETLAIGDLVSTLGGIDRPVKWIGRRSYQRRFIGRNSEANPVLIRAGALGPGVPHRDLTVSGKHAMFFDGVFVRAEDLVNGDTITRDTGLELIEYFHVELDTADVIFANGAATETFANHNSRRMFVNWREYVDLYGSEDAVQPNADGEFERPYPLATDGDMLQAVLDSLPQPEPLRRAA
ncbi:Hint domain-containing protein, partial [Nostoc sp. NIES-2111]